MREIYIHLKCEIVQKHSNNFLKATVLSPISFHSQSLIPQGTLLNKLAFLFLALSAVLKLLFLVYRS